MRPATVRRQCGAARGGLEVCQPLAARDERDQAARTALIDDDRRSRTAIDDFDDDRRSRTAIDDRRLSIYTGAVVIVALRRAQRPVWAPGVRISGNLPISRTDRADSRGDAAFAGMAVAHCLKCHLSFACRPAYDAHRRLARPCLHQVVLGMEVLGNRG